jgi:hypothetical protein
VNERRGGGDDEDKGRKSGIHVIDLRQREREIYNKGGYTMC